MTHEWCIFFYCGKGKDGINIGFPCDKTGHIDIDRLSPAGRDIYYGMRFTRILLVRMSEIERQLKTPGTFCRMHNAYWGGC